MINNCEKNVTRATRIFDEHGDFIYQIALYKSGDKDLADDLCQNFFLSLISNPIPTDIINIKSYLYRALTNDFLDEMRRIGKRKEFLQKYANNLDFSINKKCLDDAYIEKEQFSKMFEIIGGRITPSEFKAIELRYKNGYSVSEVAERMNVKKQTVSRYLSMGLKKIKNFFKKKWKSNEWL